MKHILFGLGISLNLLLSGMNQELSPLLALPIELQCYILSFIEFTNESHETDYFFRKRLSVELEQLPTNFVAINSATGNLMLYSPSADPYPLIQCSTKKNPLQKTLNWMKTKAGFSTKQANRPILFALSPNKKMLVALLDHQLVESYAIDAAKRSKKLYDRFSLISYYWQEGLLPYPAHELEIEEYKIRGYQEKKDIFAEQTNMPEGYYNPIRKIAIANDGSIAFSNDRQIFLMNNDTENPSYQILHEEPLVWTGPFYLKEHPFFFSLKDGCFKKLIFNKQTTKIGLSYNEEYQNLADISRKFAPENPGESVSQTIYKTIFNQIYARHTIDFHKIIATLPNNETINDIDYQKKVEEILTKKKLSALKIKLNFTKKIVMHIIPITCHAWNLATYFNHKGVCKNLADNHHLSP